MRFLADISVEINVFRTSNHMKYQCKKIKIKRHYYNFPVEIEAQQSIYRFQKLRSFKWKCKMGNLIGRTQVKVSLSNKLERN